jgi:subtilisin family serine protease
MKALRLRGLLYGCLALASASGAEAGDRFILRARRSVSDLIKDYRLTPVRNLGRPKVFLVEGPDGVPPEQLLEQVQDDKRVSSFELDVPIEIAETRAAPTLSQSTAAILEELGDVTSTDFFGWLAWSGYLSQPSGDVIRLPLVSSYQSEAGSPVVAIVDTGIDPEHWLLADVLTPGYDFTRERPGLADEFADLPRSVAAALQQSTAAILEGGFPVVLNQSTAAILEPDTAEALSGEPPLPAAFGHGTMVAGLVHLIAPRARIMPLKAFRADGSSHASDVIRAIYYAVDHGARVINMSFTFEHSVQEVTEAVRHAASAGVFCVAAAGNQGVHATVYPAALPRVVGVAATTLRDERAPFSNYGVDLVKVASPGEDLITTYPGSRYAAVSGTSFSAGILAGTLAVMVGLKPELTFKEAMTALDRSRYLGAELGYGRVDLPRVFRAVRVRRDHKRE